MDDKNPDNYSLNLNQAGLGLPDRDYYLKDDKALADTRAAYRKYLADMMTLAGMSDTDARAERILALETEIAKVQWTRADRRDEDKIYNPMTISELKTLAPDFAWDAFLAEAHIPLTTRQWRALCHRGGEDRVRAAGEDLRRHAGLDLARLSDRALSAAFRGLSAQALRRPQFRLLRHGAGAATPSSSTARPAACICSTGMMGEALGKLYVARYFPPEAKAKADQLVSNLLKAYEADIQTLDWMSPATRAKALEKIQQFTPKIGYPVIGAIIPPMTCERDDLIGDIQRAHGVRVEPRGRRASTSRSTRPNGA